MTPEDVLLEAIAAASLFGDSSSLREMECRKLRESIKRYAGIVLMSDGVEDDKGDTAR